MPMRISLGLDSRAAKSNGTALNFDISFEDATASTEYKI